MTRGWLPDLRDWSITTGGGCKIGGGGGHVKFYPYEKGGGRGRTFLPCLRGGGGGAQKVSDP